MQFSFFLEKGEMGETCGTHGAEEKCEQVLCGKTLKKSLDIFRRISEDNIKQDLKQTGWEAVDWIYLSRLRYK